MIKFGAYFSLWSGTLALAWGYYQANSHSYMWAALGIGTLWTWGLVQRANETLTASQRGFIGICKSRFPALIG